jgi:hypothetical protein
VYHFCGHLRPFSKGGIFDVRLKVMCRHSRESGNFDVASHAKIPFENFVIIQPNVRFFSTGSTGL